jgi:hypothetical protein
MPQLRRKSSWPLAANSPCLENDGSYARVLRPDRTLSRRERLSSRISGHKYSHVTFLSPAVSLPSAIVAVVRSQDSNPERFGRGLGPRRHCARWCQALPPLHGEAVTRSACSSIPWSYSPPKHPRLRLSWHETSNHVLARVPTPSALSDTLEQVAAMKFGGMCWLS